LGGNGEAVGGTLIGVFDIEIGYQSTSVTGSVRQS